MRPKSVVQAEWLYLLSILLLIVTAAATWNSTVAQVGMAATVGVVAFGVGLSLLLLLLTTRGRSRVALWLLTGWTVIGALGVLKQVADGVLAIGLIGVLTVVQLLLTIVPIVLLFRPHARAWFAAGREEDLDDEFDDAEDEA